MILLLVLDCRGAVPGPRLVDWRRRGSSSDAAHLPPLTGELRRHPRADGDVADAQFALGPAAARCRAARRLAMCSASSAGCTSAASSRTRGASRSRPIPDDPVAAGGVLVITPNAGLRAADTPVTLESFRAFAGVDDRPEQRGVPRPARTRRPRPARRRRAGLRGGAARQHRVGQVRGPAAADLRRPPDVSAGRSSAAAT